jgi:hypothetical protein
MKYWIEGYNGVPGSLYFKTQEGKIKNRITGQPENAICRDVDLYMHVLLNASKKNKRSAGIIKGRGSGLSTDFGIQACYSIITNPGSNVNLTSKDQCGISELFGEKVLFCYENLDPHIRPKLKNKSKNKQSSFLSLYCEYENMHGELKTGVSRIDAISTSASDKAASVFSGIKALLGIYDELPIHPRKAKLLNSSFSCYQNPRTKELDGFLIWGGTIEGALSNADLIEFKKTIEQADTWKSDIIFLDCVWGMESPDKVFNGWTNWEYGNNWHEQELERLLKTGYEKSICSFKKNYPRSIKDIFELVQCGYQEDDVASIKDRSKVSSTMMKIYESPKGLNFAPVCQYTELPKQMESKFKPKLG